MTGSIDASQVVAWGPLVRRRLAGSALQCVRELMRPQAEAADSGRVARRVGMVGLRAHAHAMCRFTRLHCMLSIE